MDIGTVVSVAGLPFVGTIVDINDRKAETLYRVEYTGGIGHGVHTSNELHVANEDMASYWYPEFGTAIADNPSKHLSRTASVDDDSIYMAATGCHHPSCGRRINYHHAAFGWDTPPVVAPAVPGAMDIAHAFRSARGFHSPEGDYTRVMADPARHAEIAKHYLKAPEYDELAIPAFKAFRDEIHDQYHHLKNSGVEMQVSHIDPYRDHHEMLNDIQRNGRLKVLSTQVTGPHPLLSNEDNDRFRFVHDFFGHAATQRGFDRHGEEAAWLHHSSMFSPLARRALTTESRGQNAALIHTGEFQPQKITLLPEKFSNDEALKNVKTALDGSSHDEEECPSCRGQGFDSSDRGACHNCGGSGRIPAYYMGHTSGLDSSETGDSSQFSTDSGSLHNTDGFVAYPEDAKCSMCNLAPVEMEVDHSPVCGTCAQSRFGVPTGAPLPQWGQTTAALASKEHLRGLTNSNRLYRGLYFGKGTPEQVEEMHRDPVAYMRKMGPSGGRTGIHWTTDPGVAQNFARGRNAWGEALDDFGEDDEDPEYTHHHGVVLEAHVHDRHVLEPGSDEWHDYADGEEIFDRNHGEQEHTVRDFGKVHLHTVHAISEDDNGYDEQLTSHPVRIHTQATKTAALVHRDYEGEVGNRSHITRSSMGTLPTVETLGKVHRHLQNKSTAGRVHREWAEPFEKDGEYMPSSSSCNCPLNHDHLRGDYKGSMDLYGNSSRPSYYYAES